MNLFSFTLACCACVGFGRRAHLPPERLQMPQQQPADSLLTLPISRESAYSHRLAVMNAFLLALRPAPLLRRAGQALQAPSPKHGLTRPTLNVPAMAEDTSKQPPSANMERSNGDARVVATTKGNISALRRYAIIGLASVGAVETTWLTLAQLGAIDGTVCSETCSLVLGGPYGNVAGVPLTLFGALAYWFVTLVGSLPLVRSDADENSNALLVLATTSMSIFSLYLMVLLALVIQSPCPYCITSALLSTGLVSLVWIGDGAVASGPTSSSSSRLSFIISSLAFGSLVYSGGNQGEEELQNLDKEEYAFRMAQQNREASGGVTKSSPRAVRIAQSLRDAGANMYGTYWCTYCFGQKNILGKEAMALVNYIECGVDAKKSDTPICRERGIKGYPTWEINGKLFPGQKSLDALEQILECGQDECGKENAPE